MSNLVSKDVLSNFMQNELDLDHAIFERLLGFLVQRLGEVKSLGGNPVELNAVAHKAKTSCRSFGASILAKKLEELEALTKDAKQSHEHLFKEVVGLIDPTLAEIKLLSGEIFEKARKSA